jgi:hypothetical protein
MGTTIRFARRRPLIGEPPHPRVTARAKQPPSAASLAPFVASVPAGRLAFSPTRAGERGRTSVEQEAREARRSLLILIGSFFVTATVMCGVVVAVASSTWTDVVIMSAFVLVFALLKIALANALIYTMLRYDETAKVPLQAGVLRGYRQFASIRQPPVVRGRRTGPFKIIKLRAPAAKAPPTDPES